MTRRRRARSASAKKRPARRGVIRRPATWLGVTALLAALLVLWIWLGPGPRAPRGAATDVVLPAGEGLPAIAGALRTAGVVGSAPAFVVAAEVTGAARALKAGEYSFPSGASLHDVLSALRHGRVVRRSVTIPEGATSRMVAAILGQASFLSGEVTAPPEGAVLPETYEVRRGEDRAEVLRRMERARDALLARLWAGRVKGLPYADPEQAVTLASIVERETALPAERPLIAAVFINRLKAGMRLESDPTVIYALTGGAPLAHGLRVSELADPSPYNTYLVTGLPPTPIANPGRAALTAALAPASSDALYFVADGTGGHVFSSDYRTHLRNVARWRMIKTTRAGETKP